MALWGNKDNIGSAQGTVGLNYATKVVTGSGTTFGNTDSIQVGDVIRFGYGPDRLVGSKYFGDAVVLSIASNTSLTIASTEGLSGVAIAGTTYTASQLPKYTTENSQWTQFPRPVGAGGTLTHVYGVSANGVSVTADTAYDTSAGWVGVTTYMDNAGNLRVKKEVLVAMSGISTGNHPVYDADPSA